MSIVSVANSKSHSLLPNFSSDYLALVKSGSKDQTKKRQSKKFENLSVDKIEQDT
jgi:hypothetical protein